MGQLTTQAMARLTAAGTISNVDEAVAALAAMKAVHLVDYDGSDEGFSLGDPNKSSEDISRDLNRFRSVSSQIDSAEVKIPLEASPIRSKLVADLPSLVDEMLTNIDRIQEIDNELASMEEEREALETISPLSLDLDLLSGYDSLTCFVGTMKNTKLASAAAVGTGVAFIADGKPSVVAVFCKNEFASDVQSSLDEGGFSAVSVPLGEGSVSDRMSELSDAADTLGGEMKSLQSELSDWADNNGVSLMGGIELLERDLSMALGPVRMAVTEHAFVIDGWVETARADEVRSALSDSCLHIDIEPFKVTPGGGGHGHHDHHVELPPIKFAERTASKPLELVTDLMGRPAYSKVDPTFFMFITYPIFFGLMLGDMLYGFGTLVLAYVLYNKIGHTDQGMLASKLLTYIGISTVVFGYIYGEFAGFELLPHYHCDEVASHGMAAASSTGCHWVGSSAPGWVSWMSMFYPNGGEIHLSTNDLAIFSFIGVGHGLPFGLELAYPFHRVSTDLMNLILLSIYIGVFHVFLGLCIGFRDVMVVGDSHGNTGFVTAFFDKGSWMAILVGMFLLGYSFMVMGSGTHSSEGYLEFLGLLFSIGGVLLGAGIVMLLYAGWKYHGYPLAISGILALIEPFGIVSNIVSYMRLAAVGVVGVKIAELGNHMFYGVVHDGHATGMMGAIEHLAHDGVEGTMALVVFAPVILAAIVLFFGKYLPKEAGMLNLWVGLGLTGLLGAFFSGATMTAIGIALAFGLVGAYLARNKDLGQLITGFCQFSFLGGLLFVGGGSYAVLLMFFAWAGVQGFAWGLGVFSPNVHAARLHLVEWMKQFYEVAGEAFAPFGFSARYVEVE